MVPPDRPHHAGAAAGLGKECRQGGKGPGSSSTFRLQMLEEVLSLVIPPLAAAEAEAEAETNADGGGGGVVGV